MSGIKQKANELRPGNAIMYEGKFWKILNTTHIKPGKGPAYIQAVTKSLDNDRNKSFRFRSDESIEIAEQSNKSYIYSYDNDDNLVFSDPITYDEVLINKSSVENFEFLYDDMEVMISFINGKPIGVTMPQSILSTVKVTDPVVKGQNAGTGRKTATLENGANVQVPLHITDGDKIIVNPNTLEYIKRG